MRITIGTADTVPSILGSLPVDGQCHGHGDEQGRLMPIRSSLDLFEDAVDFCMYRQCYSSGKYSPAVSKKTGALREVR